MFPNKKPNLSQSPRRQYRQHMLITNIALLTYSLYASIGFIAFIISARKDGINYLYRLREYAAEYDHVDEQWFIPEGRFHYSNSFGIQNDH